jgi:subtilisin family serine protease
MGMEKMKRKQAIFLLVILGLVSITSFTFVKSEPNNVSSKLQDELSTIQTGTIDVIIETYTQDYSSIISEVESRGGIITNTFGYTSGLAAKVPIDAFMKLKAISNVKTISKDELRYPTYSINSLGRENLDFALTNEKELSLNGREFHSFSRSQVVNVLNNIPETYWNFLSMNAAPVWSAGYMGQDSLVAIIDTGVYDQHFMISHAVIGGVDVSPDNGNPDWNSPLNHWHGTHCAGIVAGSGVITLSPDDFLYESYVLHTGIAWVGEDFGLGGEYADMPALPLFGMAPLAQIYGIKVFPSDGSGVPTSYIINAIEQAIALHESGTDVDVISMSLGGGTGFDGRDLEAQVVDYATSLGITVVSSAGNEGPASLTIGSPECANTAIAVGATADPANTRIFWEYDNYWYLRAYEGYTHDDARVASLGLGYYLYTSETPQVIYFSSRGPTSDGRHKPELCATGVFVLSSMTPGQGLGWASGTSMACPAVSGAVSLLNSMGEGFATPYDYEQALVEGSVLLEGYDTYEQGAGNLDANGAFLSLIEQFNDDDLGDKHPRLRKGFRRTPVRPKGTRIHIGWKGTATYELEDMDPGHPIEFYLRVTEFTKSIKISFSDVILNDDPLWINSFELSVQSAVRTAYDYNVDSFNIWGDAEVEIKDYSISWNGYVYGTTYYQETILQPGYYKICVENDWTSFDSISGTLEIEVEKKKFKDFRFPDEFYLGRIETNDFLGPYIFDSGTKGQIIECHWLHDWNKYPTVDLDLLIVWYNGSDWFLEQVAGGSLRSPEGVYLPDAVYSEVYVYGYETYFYKERWSLLGFYL